MRSLQYVGACYSHYLHVNNFKLFLFIKIRCIKILKDAQVFVHFISCLHTNMYDNEFRIQFLLIVF